MKALCDPQLKDYFAHSMFIGDAIGGALNVKIQTILDGIRAYLRDNKALVNAYLVGSLARQEPSVEMCPDGSIRLFSDIDLVVATTPAERLRPEIQSLQQWSRRCWPDVDVSVVFAPIDRPALRKSCFAHDLAYAFTNPVYAAVEVDRAPSVCSINRTDIYEVMIHQLGTWVLLAPAGYSSSTVTYGRQRAYRGAAAVLQCLRWLLAGDHEVKRFSDVYLYRMESLISALVHPKEVVNAIRAREVYEGHFQEYLLMPLVSAVASQQLAGSTYLLSYLELIKSLEHISLRIRDPISAFQHAILYFAFSKCDERCDWDEAIASILRILMQGESEEANGYQRLLSANSRGSEAHCAEVLRCARERYLQRLHQLNVGWPMTLDRHNRRQVVQ